ncbi:hypothetical protein C8F01DRAFT_1123117 [Mycena amicta]|nr:hypothetical protein C8F01DRAFT_1123117 [Mycena amicta]
MSQGWRNAEGSVQHELPEGTDCHIASSVPQATAQERKKIFGEAVALFGFADAVEHFKTAHDDLLHGITMAGALRPPANAVVREARIGDSPLAIFYHSTYPSPVQHLAPLQWSFYIGLSGGGVESIMLEAERKARGIRLLALNRKDRWQEFTLFQAPAALRARVEYTTDLSRTSPRRIVELVFPAGPQPTQDPILIQQLP